MLWALQPGPFSPTLFYLPLFPKGDCACLWLEVTVPFPIQRVEVLLKDLHTGGNQARLSWTFKVTPFPEG